MFILNIRHPYINYKTTCCWFEACEKLVVFEKLLFSLIFLIHLDFFVTYNFLSRFITIASIVALASAIRDFELGMGNEPSLQKVS